MKIKDSPQVTSCWLFLNNYNDARNNECKIYQTGLLFFNYYSDARSNKHKIQTEGFDLKSSRNLRAILI